MVAKRLRRTETLSTRLSLADKALIEAAAASMQKTTSAAIRDMLVKAARAEVLRQDSLPGDGVAG